MIGLHMYIGKVLKILLVPARASRTLPGAARAGNWDTPHPPNRRRAVNRMPHSHGASGAILPTLHSTHQISERWACMLRTATK